MEMQNSQFCKQNTTRQNKDEGLSLPGIEASCKSIVRTDILISGTEIESLLYSEVILPTMPR